MLERTIKMNTRNWVQTLIGRWSLSDGWKPAVRRTGRHLESKGQRWMGSMKHTSLRDAIVIGLLAPIAVGGVTRASAAAPHAGVYAWSARQQATTASLTGYVHPAVATYKNHAYILHVNDGIQATRVELTTNESGSWKTQVLSSQNLV